MLCSKKTIDLVFEEGIRVKCYPFIAMVLPVQFEDSTPFKIVFSAPKKRFRKANKRNRIKRICREAVRLNKSELENYLTQHKQQLAVFLVYTGQEEIEHAPLHKKTVKLFNNIIQTLDEQKH